MATSFKSTIASLNTPLVDVKAPLVSTPVSPPSSTKAASIVSESLVESDEPVECFNGNYKFAPIKEWQVARAMSKRYGDDLVRTAGEDCPIAIAQKPFSNPFPLPLSLPSFPSPTF